MSLYLTQSKLRITKFCMMNDKKTFSTQNVGKSHDFLICEIFRFNPYSKY